MLGDRGLAEDATQEALLSGYRAFNSFRGENLRSWLLRIVANACKDVLRSRMSRREISIDFSPLTPEDPDGSSMDLPSPDESPEDYALRRELGRAVSSGLQSLSSDWRMAVVLVDVQGYSYEEAAQIMSYSLGTVKSRLSRGRAEVRDFLQWYGELLPSQFRHDK